MPKNAGNFGKINFSTGYEKLSTVQSIAQSGRTAMDYNCCGCFTLSYLDVETETHAQCDQIGLFLKYLGNIFSCKSGPNVWRLFCLFSKMALLIKNCFVNFCVFFGKIGLLFIPTSSLTDLTCGPHSMKCFNKPNCFYK